MRLFCLVCLFLIGCTLEQPYDLAITNVTLIDGTGATAQSGVNVLVREGRIAAITTGSFGEATSIVDGTGRFLIPGLIDAHAHPFPVGETFPQFVNYGVTSILITGGSTSDRENLAHARSLSEDGTLPSPRVFHTSQHVTMEGRHPVKTYPSPNWIEGETVYYIRKAEDAVGIIGAVADQPIVGIKLTIEDGPEPPFVEMISVELVAAVVQAAHARNIEVFAHVSTMEGVRIAEEAGVDHLVHFVGVDIDWEKDSEVIERLRARDASWVTTLMIDKMLFYPAHPEWLEEVKAAGVFDPDEIARLEDRRPAEESLALLSILYDLPDPTLEKVIRPQVDDLRELHNLGFNLVVGTDTGNDFIFPGLSLHEELELLAMEFTPAELIPMATRNAARMLDVDDDLGTLEIGKWADMVLLDENPLEHIRHTRSIHAVFRGGQEQPRLTSNTPKTFDLVLANGRVMDPETGLDAIRHVGITNGKIQAVSEAPLEGREVIEASGLVVAPGFIDTNTHQHGNELFQLRAADGVTSVLNLEGGAVDINAYYNALQGKALIHYGASVAHGELRRIAQGDATLEIENGVADWPGINETRGMPELDYEGLTNAQKDSLVTLVERELQAGAVAIGYGIAYTPGATHSEILRMFDLAARYSAPSHIHLRDFDETREWDEMYEVLAGAIRWGGDLHIKHLQANYGSFTEHALAFIEKGRNHGLSITTECYPYTAASTFIDSALFDNWESWPDARFTRYEWPKTGERLTRETFARYRAEGGIIVIHPYDEDIQESAVRTCLSHPLPMIASDGAWDSGQTHPRVAGTNSRVLGRYVRQEGILPLMDALRKMSLDPANHLSRRVPMMRNKGRIQVGADADIVVFDPETVLDRATYSEPLLPPAGIEAVLVGGITVLRKGIIQDDTYPGQPIRAVVQ